MSSLLVRLALLLLVLAFPLGAQAQEVEQSAGLVCDTITQIEQFVSLHNQKVSNSDALVKVNGDKTPPACDVVIVAFYRGKVEKSVMTDGVVVEITAILVVGAYDGQQWIRTVPTPQYTIFRTKDRGA